MNYTDLYRIITTRGNKLCYPFSYNNKDVDYLDFVTNLIDEYISLIKELDTTSILKLNNAYADRKTTPPITIPLDLIKDANFVAKNVIKVLKECFRCYYDDAYHILENFFTENDYHYFKLLPQFCYNTEEDTLYRMRSDKYNFDFTNPQGELFHIPYQLRHLVSTQRYSTPGYPVLYLAGSFLTAWSELDKPKFQDVIYAKMRFIEPVKFIDLAYPLSSRPELWEYYSLFIYYPLLIACMVQVKHPNASFKPEYSLPQLMFNIARSIRIGTDIGIVYMSNKLPENADIFSISSRNFAIVIRDMLYRKGYDIKLADKMEMSDPIGFDSRNISDLYEKYTLHQLVTLKENDIKYHPIILDQE